MTLRNLFASAALSLLAVASLPAQNVAAKASAAAKIPRTADGHPDLTGVWSNATRTPFERPAEFNGKATLTDEEAKDWETKEAQGWKDLDGTSEGPLHATKGSQGTGAYNVLFYDMGSGLARYGGKKRTSMVVDPPDGHLPPLVAGAAPARRLSTIPGDYKGLSNDTRCLVGNTPAVPMTPALYNDNYQIVQSADTKTIEYRATMEDPATWTRPWSLELPFNKVPGPLYEYACHEGNYAITDILGGAAK